MREGRRTNVFLLALLLSALLFPLQSVQWKWKNGRRKRNGYTGVSHAYA